MDRQMIVYLVQNKIGATGAKYLARADWKQLQEFNVGTNETKQGHNQIGDKGCEYLMKTNWKNLKKLWLCNVDVKQLRIISHKMGLNCSSKEIGKN